MEDNSILDPLLDSNIAALHYVYMPKIVQKLAMWNRTWCRHRMRTTKASPMQLWIAGQYQNPQGIYLSPEQLGDYGLEGDIEQQERNPRPIFCLPHFINQECLQDLDTRIATDTLFENHGITAYLEAVDIIEEHLVPNEHMVVGQE